MKIGLVCPYNMLDRPGGIPQFVMHLHEGLVKRGHEVKVITQRPSSYKGDAPRDYILLGTTRTFKGGLGTEGNWGMPSDNGEMAEVLEHEKFDVINFHEPWLPMLAWQMVKHSTAAHVGSFHANLMDTAAGKSWTLLKPYGAPLIRKMDIITATSPASAGMLLSRANLKSSRDRELMKGLTYIPCAVELSKYKPYKKRTPLNGPKTKTIVYLGRLEKRKGVEHLLTAFAALVQRMPNAHLIIAGDGLVAKTLIQRVATEKIKNVKFTGYVSEEEKRRLLGNAELACFPSTFGEGFGIVLLEAMAMGTPLLAGNNLGYVNVMTGPGKIGLIDPEATEDFVNRLEVFLTDETQRKIMSSWALKSVRQFDYPKVVDQYEKVFRDAVAIRNKRQRKSKQLEHDKKKKIIRRIFIRRYA